MKEKEREKVEGNQTKEKNGDKQRRRREKQTRERQRERGVSGKSVLRCVNERRKKKNEVLTDNPRLSDHHLPPSEERQRKTKIRSSLYS